MMNLGELQRRVASAVMSPLKTPIGAEAKALVKPNDRLSATERLAIYHRQYWYRILDSLAEDFPGLAAVLGERAFDRLARAYLEDCPSQSFTLRNLGSHLEAWLAAHPEFGGRNLALALDMVRLEWAHTEAFDGPERKPLGPEDLLELGPELSVALQPYIGLLELRYPVDELRIELNKHAEAHERASNAVSAPLRRRVARRFTKSKAEAIFLAVHRAELSVYYRRLEPLEFRLLRAIGERATIGAALDSMEGLAPTEVQAWFANWARLGWLCRAAV
jgi:hypothetical protein